jgi:hypothetical protein
LTSDRASGWPMSMTHDKSDKSSQSRRIVDDKATASGWPIGSTFDNSDKSSRPRKIVDDGRSRGCRVPRIHDYPGNPGIMLVLGFG